MQTYTITNRKQNHRLTESSGVVTSCTIEFLEGLPFVTARNLLKQKGWIFIPDLEEPINMFEFHGSTYEIVWKQGTIVSIVKDGEEISWQELPEQLKGIL